LTVLVCVYVERVNIKLHV